MTKPALQEPKPRAGTEYTIYVFERPEKSQMPRWQRHGSMASLAQASQQAGFLFRTGLYEKVEIKQKFFDRRRSRYMDVTLKVLERGRDTSSLIARLLKFMLDIFPAQ